MRDANNVPQPKLDAAGKPVPYLISYPTMTPAAISCRTTSASSVVGIHKIGMGIRPGYGRHPDSGGI